MASARAAVGSVGGFTAVVVLRVRVPVPMVEVARTGTREAVGGIEGASLGRPIPVVASLLAVAYYSSLTTGKRCPLSPSPNAE